jgi:hypothetical protein
MKNTIIMFFAAMTLLSSCNSGNMNSEAPLTNNVDSVSYAIGANLGSNILRQIVSAGDTTLSFDAMTQGFSQAINETDLAIEET